MRNSQMKKANIIYLLTAIIAFNILHFSTFNAEAKEANIYYDFDDTEIISENFSMPCGESVTWNYDFKSETVTISGKGDMYEEGWQFTQYYTDEYRSNKKTVKRIIIEDGVTSISKYAFSEFRKLKTVTIGDDVKLIKDGAFEGCIRLKNVYFSDKVKQIGNYAFNLCLLLEKINLPQSVETIGDFCFSECNLKGSLSLPSKLKQLGECAFVYCKNIEEVIVPRGVNQIYSDTFAGNVKLVVLNKNCKINGGVYAEISGYSGSQAQKYANANGIPFIQLDEHPHTYTSEITRKATCAKAGVITYTCYCGDVYTKSIAKTEHTYKTATTKATVDKNGKTAKTCTVCGDVKSLKTIYKISSVKLSATSYIYDGKVKTPGVTIKDSKGNVLKKDMDYTLKYSSGRKNIGTYKVKVTFNGNYSGSKTLSFKIILGKVKGLEIIRTDDLVIVKWNEVKGATGYEVYEYSEENGKFIKIGTFGVNSLKNSSAKDNTRLRVRAYYVDKSGNVYYGAYSEAIVI